MKAFRMTHRKISALSFCLMLITIPAFAQRNLRNIPKPNVEKELAAFQVPEGFKMELFADETQLSKPIHMNFDSAGRLWVVSSPLYPHIKPGDVPRDEVIVLEDTDGDGRADKSTVFAENLLVPTGIEIGDGGVYVASSHELVHLADTDGDGKADRRRVIFSGFGTEDTHHLIHTFRWGPDGSLYFNQSIYIHSHIETPHGVRRMNGGGVWRFRTDQLKLDAYMFGMCNPWGHDFDYWGQFLGTDGAGFEGVHYLMPGATCRHAPRSDPILPGLNPGSPKYCGAEFIDSPHFPDDWQGNLITGDFRAHRVSRFVLSDNGSAFSAAKQKDIAISSHVAFRPIDQKIGPDGALYIADWYNPIIQHGEVGFRDERRNHTHGRIWKLRHATRPLQKNPRLDQRSVPELVAKLASTSGWERHFAKRELSTRDTAKVVAALDSWVSQLDKGSSIYEHNLLEALWMKQTLDLADEKLLRRVLSATEPRCRAAGLRVLKDWKNRISNPLPLVGLAIEDPFARVRLEAIRVAGSFKDLAAVRAISKAIDHPMDSFLDYGLALAYRDLSSVWLPALREGRFDFDGQTDRIEYALRAVKSSNIAKEILSLAKRKDIARDRRIRLTELAVRVGGPEASNLGLELALALADDSTAPAALESTLSALVEAVGRRGVRPKMDLAPVARLLETGTETSRQLAVELVGLLRIETLAPQLARRAQSGSRVALDALAALGGKHVQVVQELSRSSKLAVSIAATAALTRADVQRAAQATTALMSKKLNASQVSELIDAFLTAKDGPKALESALRSGSPKIDKDSAKLAARSIRDSATANDKLLSQFRSLAGLGQSQEVTEAERNRLLDKLSMGNADRGAHVFRRDDLRCSTCHALSGAGGRVGPDLSTIGASAQPDYVLDSLFYPSRAVKEGYHAVTAVTKRGEVVTGVKLRRTASELVVRTADDREVSIPVSALLQESDARSLMPKGLHEELTEQELLDLAAFLNSLGKGKYAAPSQTYFRTWRRLVHAPPRLLASGDEGLGRALNADDTLEWKRDYSGISGLLPLDASTRFLSTTLELTAAGPVSLATKSSKPRAVWIGGKSVSLASLSKLQLAAGTHQIIVDLGPGESARIFGIEFSLDKSSSARGLPKTGP